MFYAPNLTDENIGAKRGPGSMVFMNSTQPHGILG